MKYLAVRPFLVDILTMTKLDELKAHLKPGQAYRRGDLARWSTSVDRHIKQLVKSGVLKKLSGGLYAYPKETAFGPAPASDRDVVSAFLKDDRFLLASPTSCRRTSRGSSVWIAMLMLPI
jgi:hypothetical protein